MNAKTGAERNALYEQRNAEAGLVRRAVWIYPEDSEALQKFAAKLRIQRRTSSPPEPEDS